MSFTMLCSRNATVLVVVLAGPQTPVVTSFTNSSITLEWPVQLSDDSRATRFIMHYRESPEPMQAAGDGGDGGGGGDGDGGDGGAATTTEAAPTAAPDATATAAAATAAGGDDVTSITPAATTTPAATGAGGGAGALAPESSSSSHSSSAAATTTVGEELTMNVTAERGAATVSGTLSHLKRGTRYAVFVTAEINPSDQARRIGGVLGDDGGITDEDSDDLSYMPSLRYSTRSALVETRASITVHATTSSECSGNNATTCGCSGLVSHCSCVCVCVVVPHYSTCGCLCWATRRWHVRAVAPHHGSRLSY